MFATLWLANCVLKSVKYTQEFIKITVFFKTKILMLLG